MKTLTRMLGVLVPAMLSACHVGPQIGELAAPRQPGGAWVVIAIDADRRPGLRYEGELVAVRADGVIIARPSTSSKLPLTVVRWEEIVRLTATELPGFRARPERAKAPPREAEIERLRLVSRYPQGLSPELTANLLAAYEQESLDSLETEAK